MSGRRYRKSKSHNRSYSKPLFDPQRLLYFSTTNQRLGKVIRPKWFEGDAVVILQARIHSGDYVTKRRYRVTVPAEKSKAYATDMACNERKLKSCPYTVTKETIDKIYNASLTVE